MKFGIKNTRTGAIATFSTREELREYCEEIGLKLNTLERARKEGRKSLTGFTLINGGDYLKSSHLANLKGNKKIVLVIGDIHLPFTLEAYLGFCKSIYTEYNCNEVVFLGDILDAHSYSAHKASNSSKGVNDEFDLALQELKKWYDVFPYAKVCIGNHDSRNRYGNFKDLKIPDKVFKPFNELLEVPNWEFDYEFIIDNVKYHHGLGRNPKSEALNDCISVVAGHRHSEGYIHYFVDSKNVTRFGMQVGSALDPKSYASAYAKGSKPQHCNVAVVEGGKKPILIYMEDNNE